MVGPTHFVDEKSMNKFIEDTKDDLMNPNYHLYGDMYLHSFTTANLDLWSLDASRNWMEKNEDCISLFLKVCPHITLLYTYITTL